MSAFFHPQPPPSPTTARIAIIGTGSVGSAIAYALLHGSQYSDLLLVDANPNKLDAQVRDLSDAACAEGSSTRVRRATLRDAAGCDVIVIAAGVKRRRAETRVQQLERTTATLCHIVDGMKPFLLPSTILLVVTNPVDVLTTLAYWLTSLSSSQVLGLGTYLDTVTLRRIIGEELKIPPESIHADILGTNDDSPQAESLACSTAVMTGLPVRESTVVLPDFSATAKTELVARSREESHLIANVKGASTFSIASSVARIISAVLYDNKAQVPLFGRMPDHATALPPGPMPISHFQEKLGCCISLPALLGREGVVRTVQVKLEEREEKKLARAGVNIRETVERLLGDGTIGGKEEEE
ncbi:L-lactate dehydrogenase A [Cladophialophora carrionii]|uniref:L-lactate dehydrogenase A n=1 Tax=Cladophialophora carrionii TaxID=86049 RepID=A0A1C1CXG1_9EURO|nr:L-lactate dehydrogenase A [Cladophialophora carrionii]